MVVSISVGSLLLLCVLVIYFCTLFPLLDADRTQNEELLKLTVTTSHCFIFVTDYDEESSLLTTDAKQIASKSNTFQMTLITVSFDRKSVSKFDKQTIGLSEVKCNGILKSDVNLVTSDVVCA